VSKRSKHLRTDIRLRDQAESNLGYADAPQSPFVGPRSVHEELRRYRDALPGLGDLFVASRYHTDDRRRDQA
jgi:hypothetical protein